jgi:small GTP-binding protein
MSSVFGLLIPREMSLKPPMAYDLLTKILLVGDSGVGKTSLLMRFSDREFVSNYITTIGIDFRVKMIDVDGRRVKVQIWDTAGQERFRSITKSYYRGSHAIVMVYDATDRVSFKRITSWLIDVKKHMVDGDNFITILVANKCDLDHLRQVTYEEGKTLADENGMKYYETSAKNPSFSMKPTQKPIDSVDHLFYQTIKDVLVNVLQQPPPVGRIQPAINLQKGDFKDRLRQCCS